MSFFSFSDRGVLGLNARNLLYIKPWNPRKATAFADDKMKTKSFLSARGIPTARVFARIDNRRQLKKFNFSALPDECVLKPNYGFGGEGILILRGRKDGEFLEQGKTPISEARLVEHIEDILDGKFSVNGRQDTAFFEQILEADESFAPFRPAGLPDIRIVVFNLVPVMAMLRIPTAVSHGKANIHLGGIGIGIDIAKGVTTHAAQYSTMLTELSHGTPVGGHKIARWDELLLISSKIQQMTNIGYLAVDLTLDRELGPVLLEVNARAGLTVQVANLAPLKARLERVEGLQVSTPEKGVRLAQELFGQKIDRRTNDAESERPVIGMRETLEIAGEGFSVEEPTAVLPEHEHSVFSEGLIADLLARGSALTPVAGKKNMFKAKLTLAGKKFQTLVQSGITPAGVRAVIGKRDLKGFLIDAGKKDAVLQVKVKKDIRALDSQLSSIDRGLPVLKLLRPVNLSEEVERLRDDEMYEPVFQLREQSLELADMERDLAAMQADDSPLGILLRKKCRELLLKIELIKARGDPVRFTAASLALYGSPSPALLGFANAHIASRPACDLPAADGEDMDAEQAKKQFDELLESYGLHDWQVQLRDSMIADCAVGDHRVFIKRSARFSPVHLKALFAHEVETHALTAENGALQPYELFRRGFANYLDTQEGLAVFTQERVLPPSHEKRFVAAKSVLAVAYAMEHSFAETRKYLVQELGFSRRKALTKTLDVKRGLGPAERGAFTRSLVYFRGFRAISQFVHEGGDLTRLYIGKIAMEDLPLLEKIEGLRKPVIVPLWLRKAPLAAPKTSGKATKTRKKSS